jgi:hypothetical protein
MRAVMGRSGRRFLFSLLFVFCLHLNSANANGIDKTIGSGEPVSGIVAGKGADIYKIAVEGGNKLAIRLDGKPSPVPTLIIAGFGAVSLAQISPAGGGPVSGPAKVSVYTPTGDFAGKITCAQTCNLNFLVKARGVWTLVVSKLDQDEAAAKYALSVNEQG